jgi:hypothetical protein
MTVTVPLVVLVFISPTTLRGKWLLKKEWLTLVLGIISAVKSQQEVDKLPQGNLSYLQLQLPAKVH